MAASKDYGFTPGKDIRELDKYMNDWFNAKFSNIWPVGAVVILMDSDGRNPLDLGYPGKRWSLIGAGKMLVCRSNTSGSPWYVPNGQGGGTATNAHTHIVFDTEDMQGEINPDDRVILADYQDANNPSVDQEASQAASEAAGLGSEPVHRFILHSDNSHSTYNPSAEYIPYEYGKLEYRPTWPVTILNNDPTHYTISQNSIKASYYGEAPDPSTITDSGSNYPPYVACNIWRREA